MTSQLKVLCLTASTHIGGAERLILDLANQINSTRFETHICVLESFSHNASFRQNASFLPDIQRTGLPVYVIGTKRSFSLTNFIAIFRYIRQHQINIIHTHLTDANMIGHIVGRLSGCRVISTLHNEPPKDNQKRSYKLGWLERITARYLANHLVAVSNRVRTMHIKEWHIPEEKISTIYNGIDMQEYLKIPEDAGQNNPDTEFVITNVAKLSVQKAQHLLLEAAKLVLEQKPNVRFMIVGRGPLEQQLKEQAEALGIAGRVTFTGLRRDIPAILSQSDIFVLSSLWEGLPISALEAMAAARAVVLTDVGGNSELVEHGTNGLIVPPGDVPALANTLLSLINDSSYRLSLGKAARSHVQREFNIDFAAKQYETLYEKMCGEHHVPIRAKSIMESELE